MTTVPSIYEMKDGNYSIEIARRIARTACSMRTDIVIDNISLKEVRTPWDEKVYLRFNKTRCDISLNIWKSPQFLTARIFRLVLYILDSLDPAFKYDGNALIPMNINPKIRHTHNHIWGIYIDSRIEKMGYENFFDRGLRRNLFIDSQKTYPWAISGLLFDKLWARSSFTHPEIIDSAYNLSNLIDQLKTWDHDAFEIEINRSIADHSVQEHIEKIASPLLRDIASTLLSFVTNRCRGTLIEPSYYGIYFMCDQEIFAEMVVTKKDSLLLTLFDFQLEKHIPYIITKQTKDIKDITEAIKDIYDKISFHSSLKAIKNPYNTPIER